MLNVLAVTLLTDEELASVLELALIQIKCLLLAGESFKHQGCPAVVVEDGQYVIDSEYPHGFLPRGSSTDEQIKELIRHIVTHSLHVPEGSTQAQIVEALLDGS